MNTYAPSGGVPTGEQFTCKIPQTGFSKQYYEAISVKLLQTIFFQCPCSNNQLTVKSLSDILTSFKMMKLLLAYRLLLKPCALLTICPVPHVSPDAAWQLSLKMSFNHQNQ